MYVAALGRRNRFKGRACQVTWAQIHQTPHPAQESAHPSPLTSSNTNTTTLQPPLPQRTHSPSRQNPASPLRPSRAHHPLAHTRPRTNSPAPQTRSESTTSSAPPRHRPPTQNLARKRFQTKNPTPTRQSARAGRTSRLHFLEPSSQCWIGRLRDRIESNRIEIVD